MEIVELKNRKTYPNSKIHFYINDINMGNFKGKYFHCFPAWNQTFKHLIRLYKEQYPENGIEKIEIR